MQFLLLLLLLLHAINAASFVQRTQQRKQKLCTPPPPTLRTGMYEYLYMYVTYLLTSPPHLLPQLAGSPRYGMTPGNNSERTKPNTTVRPTKHAFIPTDATTERMVPKTASSSSAKPWRASLCMHERDERTSLLAVERHLCLDADATFSVRVHHTNHEKRKFAGWWREQLNHLNVRVHVHVHTCGSQATTRRHLITTRHGPSRSFTAKR